MNLNINQHEWFKDMSTSPAAPACSAVPPSEAAAPAEMRYRSAFKVTVGRSCQHSAAPPPAAAVPLAHIANVQYHDYHMKPITMTYRVMTSTCCAKSNSDEVLYLVSLQGPALRDMRALLWVRQAAAHSCSTPCTAVSTQARRRRARLACHIGLVVLSPQRIKECGGHKPCRRRAPWPALHAVAPARLSRGRQPPLKPAPPQLRPINGQTRHRSIH